MKNEHRRRDFLKIGAIALCGTTRWARLAAAEDEPGVHGMLVVGEHSVYLSHLPMFGPPHDYQVILEVVFTTSGGDPQADYFKDRKQTGSMLYTLEPERFVLPRLTANSPLRSFKASVSRALRAVSNQDGQGRRADRAGYRCDGETRHPLCSIRSGRREADRARVPAVRQARRMLPGPHRHQTAGLRSDRAGQVARSCVHRRTAGTWRAGGHPRQAQLRLWQDHRRGDRDRRAKRRRRTGKTSAEARHRSLFRGA